MISFWYEEYLPDTFHIGGLRVSRVTTNGPFTGKTLITEYSYQKANGESSGEITSQLCYSYEYSEMPEIGGDDYYMILNSNTVYPFSTTSGSYVGYDLVTEIRMDEYGNPLGKTEYKYLSPNNYPDQQTYLYPNGNG